MIINGKKHLSPIGLGCWALGGDQWGPKQEDGDSITTIRAAFEAGVNHFDTAQAYGRGHGEELIGKALKGVRDDVVIATKIFYTPREKVESAVTASLRRLQTDWIDILYIHWPKKGGDLAGTMEGLEVLRRKGVIRKIGVSNFSIADIREVMKTGAVDYCQLCYNILWRRDERETIPFCLQKKINIITYSSLAEGILTGKFGNTVDFPSNDHRKYTVLFDKALWPKVYETVEKLKSIASETRPTVSLAHCAIQWLLAREGVVSVLVGARSREQVESNLKALQYNDSVKRLLDRMTGISDDLSLNLPDERNIFKWYP
jgi:myo-inositol catabolism protein IolS